MRSRGRSSPAESFTTSPERGVAVRRPGSRRPGSAQPGARPPAWLTAALSAGSIGAASRLGWGFTNESWRVDLADERRLVVTRYPTTSLAQASARRSRELAPRLRGLGVHVPEIVEDLTRGRMLVTAFVDGVPGAACLDDASGPELVGGAMGRASRAIGRVDTRDLTLVPSWASAAGLAAADADGAVAGALARLDVAIRPRVEARVARGRALLRDRPIGLSHGDFAPVNAIIDGDGLAALVDLEHAALADPLFDAAWFRWIVLFHHPAIAPRTWRAFKGAATGGDETDEPLLRVLPVLGLLERLASATRESDVEHWRSMLTAIVNGAPDLVASPPPDGRSPTDA